MAGRPTPGSKKEMLCKKCKQQVEVFYLPGEWTWSKHKKSDGKPCPNSGRRM